MNLKKNIRAVFNKVQDNKSSHQQNIKVLKRIYEKVSVEDFFNEIQSVLKILFSVNSVSHKSIYAERTLLFLASFIAEMTPWNDNDEDFSDHPFLTMVIKETLKYQNLFNHNYRYNSCLFIKLILQNIGEKNLDSEICDLIQDAMLDRAQDPKSSVRLEAVTALVRLQDPMNSECPVIEAYLSLIVDPNAQIRTQVVKSVAVNVLTIQQLLKRICDEDANVRMAAFRKYSDFGPRHLKIFERQFVISSGLKETNMKVKNVFTENLLPKWLQMYNNNYINFLNALKLDADENDITNTEKIVKGVINVLLNTTPIDDIISALPLTEEKLLPLDKLSSEVVTIWSVLVQFLRNDDGYGEYLEQIIPNLRPFCDYIEKFVKAKGKSTMEDWEFLDYQNLLKNLLYIVEGYDLADEVGRRTLHLLTVQLLKEENLQFKLKKQIVTLSKETSQKTDDFTNIICLVISEIQEYLVEKEIEQNVIEETNKECQKAQCKVNIIRLESELEDAVENKNFNKAGDLVNEINQIKQKLKKLSTEELIVEKVKMTKDDPKTICDCLEILICLLQLPTTTELTPSLLAAKDEFVIKLLSSNNGDIHSRVLECLCLFCEIDQNNAEEFLKIICMPLITYRTVKNYNKHAMVVSLRAVSDLLRLYGSQIFGAMEDSISTSNQSQTAAGNGNKRKLYSSGDSDESCVLANRFHLEAIIEVILDTLDDECSDIRNVAMESIAKLILNHFPASSHLITRLVLKWYNPLTAKASDKLQQLIGVVLSNYAHAIDGAQEVIASASIPILRTISIAPKTSPLTDIDVNNLLLFLTTITTSDSKRDLGTHLNMAHMVLNEITKTKNSLLVVYLSKMLLHLEICTENNSVIKELICEVNATLANDNLENPSKKNLLKFKEKLNAVLENRDRTINTNSEITENSRLESANGIEKCSSSLDQDKGYSNKTKILNGCAFFSTLPSINEGNESVPNENIEKDKAVHSKDSQRVNKDDLINMTNNDRHSECNQSEKRRKISGEQSNIADKNKTNGESNSDLNTSQETSEDYINSSNSVISSKTRTKKRGRCQKSPDSLELSTGNENEECLKRLKVNSVWEPRKNKENKKGTVEVENKLAKLQVRLERFDLFNEDPGGRKSQSKNETLTKEIVNKNKRKLSRENNRTAKRKKLEKRKINIVSCVILNGNHAKTQDKIQNTVDTIPESTDSDHSGKEFCSSILKNRDQRNEISTKRENVNNYGKSRYLRVLLEKMSLPVKMTKCKRNNTSLDISDSSNVDEDVQTNHTSLNARRRSKRKNVDIISETSSSNTSLSDQKDNRYRTSLILRSAKKKRR